MLDTLITSKTRIKLLVKFFLNCNSSSYLRSLENEFGESSNSIRLELNKFEKSGLLISTHKGNRKYFKANTNHPLFKDIHSILLKYIGFDNIIEKVIKKLGDLDSAFVTGDIAEGRDSNNIDLFLVGNNIDKTYLQKLISKVEVIIQKKIRYLVINNEDSNEYLAKLNDHECLMLWGK
ncbi:MAG: ArsR family transcriptional regulator [Bacteroidia bacterium]|nr:ArsR family transcriptional regulator [Bacteroidia bacterium]